ncbi:hypothetical protein HMPREF0281_02342 [Corynebacterium ammoniagenes DSM 20306]|uniref:Uncharacterized protein n=1 Tax=Corynebacterium ammoniagenes DSM 20306 TaxID=649754 RepID=A0ABN0ABY1_CORAM|nr:hypothetical protein HMPREF0281_02342 [Corynebacterium ammoniagenes DSM 20306]
MQVIARIQTDIARNHQQLETPQSRPLLGDNRQRVVDIDTVADAVFIRPASHYEPRKQG